MRLATRQSMDGPPTPLHPPPRDPTPPTSHAAAQHPTRRPPGADGPREPDVQPDPAAQVHTRCDGTCARAPRCVERVVGAGPDGGRVGTRGRRAARDGGEDGLGRR